MKIYQKPSVCLQLFNILSFVATLATILFTGITFSNLPDDLNISETLAGNNAGSIDKDKIWEDIRLMVTSYLVISLLSIYLQLIRFKDGNGKNKVLVVSFLNLCISLVFSFTIVNCILGNKYN